MKYRSLFLALLMVLMVWVRLTNGQEGPGVKKPRTPADYEARTLKDLAMKASDTNSRSDMADTRIVYAEILPTRVRVSYTGSTRLLPQLKKDVLYQWARLYAGSMESYTTPYETEMLFKENGVRYWVAVKKDSLPLLKKKLKRNEALDLFLIRLGAARTADRWEPLMLVENFQKLK
jgi:hypothetical protein